MSSVREKWTDERMDDLSHRVGEGFNRVDADLRALRSDMASEFAAMNRMLIQFASVMIAALIALFAAQIGVIVSLL